MSHLVVYEDLPRAGTVAVHAAHRRRAVEASRRASGRAARTSHVRRDVGRASLTEAAVLLAGLGSVLRVLQAEVVHVELVRHDCDVVVPRGGGSGLRLS